MYTKKISSTKLKEKCLKRILNELKKLKNFRNKNYEY